MYIPSFVLQTLHEDRIRDGQRTARNRAIPATPSFSLFSRISNLLRARTQRATSETSDARRAHAI